LVENNEDQFEEKGVGGMGWETKNEKQKGEGDFIAGFGDFLGFGAGGRGCASAGQAGARGEEAVGGNCSAKIGRGNDEFRRFWA
jgi:hypothetical protein